MSRKDHQTRRKHRDRRLSAALGGIPETWGKIEAAMLTRAERASELLATGTYSTLRAFEDGTRYAAAKHRIPIRKLVSEAARRRRVRDNAYQWEPPPRTQSASPSLSAPPGWEPPEQPEDLRDPRFPLRKKIANDPAP